MKRFPLLIAVCALAAVSGLAACGGDDNKDNTTAATTSTTDTTTTDTGATGAATVKVSADPSGALKFEQSSLSASPGQDKFEFTNQSSTPHDIVIEDSGGKELAKTSIITQDTATTEATLKAGKYTYFCSVPGHREAGMEGTLTVK